MPTKCTLTEFCLLTISGDLNSVNFAVQYMFIKQFPLLHKALVLLKLLWFFEILVVLSFEKSDAIFFLSLYLKMSSDIRQRIISLRNYIPLIIGLLFF